MRFDLRAGFPLVTTKQAASALHHLRASVVPARRHQRQVSARAQRHHLGRVGRRERRFGPGIRQAVAQLADRGWPQHRSARARGRADQEEPEFAAHHRERVERRRTGSDGAAAVPCPVPVLCGRRSVVLPAVPAQRRCAARRAVQYRLLRAAHAHDRAAMRLSRSASSSGRAAIATCT